jgi:hypothetical protein
MKKYLDEISKLVNHENIKSTIHSFDSGAFMIDIWVKGDFYCIQLFDDKFGISQIKEDLDLSVTPDKSFSEWEVFKSHLCQILTK